MAELYQHRRFQPKKDKEEIKQDSNSRVTRNNTLVRDLQNGLARINQVANNAEVSSNYNMSVGDQDSSMYENYVDQDYYESNEYWVWPGDCDA